MLLTLLSGREISPVRTPNPEGTPAPSRAARVMLPPPEVLRQILRPPAPAPAPRPPAAEPAPPPAEAKAKAKDRISIGPPSTERAKGPLELRREDDLTKTPKGRPNVSPQAAATPPPVARADSSPAAGSAEPNTPGNPGLRLPPGLGELERGDGGVRSRPGAERERSIASSLRNLERRIQDAGPAGLPTGTGQQMGPLFFDPEGADFTVWINHFKNEVYRNWIVPQPALMGFRGHVDIEFTVERDGSLSNLRMLKSAGTPALDRAAMNALQGSRLMPLPADYGPARVTMQVTFFYNEGPRES